MALEKTTFYRPFPIKAVEKYLELLPSLIQASRGAAKADAVVRNATLADVVTGALVEGVSIAIYKGFITALIKSSRDDIYIGSDALVIDAKGFYVAPGFIDAHVHVESSMLSPEEFSRLALRHGVTLAVVDPHEVANVGGAEYVIRFAERASRQILKMLVQVPCCVPPTDPHLDNPGAKIDSNDIERLLSTGLFHSLGEFMDFTSVVNGDREAVKKIFTALSKGLTIYGHIPTSDEMLLNPYAVASISSCHESTDVEEVLEKLRRGMWVMLRLGTAWRDAEKILPKLVVRNIDLSRTMVVSDDISVIDLVERGYMDNALKTLIELGLDPIKALKLVTINPATYLRLDNLVGIVAPGRIADIIILRSVEKAHIDTVIVEGIPVYRDGEELIEFNGLRWTRTFSPSPINIPPITGERDLVVKVPQSAREVGVIVAEVVRGTPLTRKVIEALDVVDGVPIVADDVMYVASIDRYRGRYIGKGFAKGVNMLVGAIAQTISHDTHNIVVIGRNAKDMLLAVKELAKLGGGIVAVDKGRLICSVKLDEAGLMSSKRAEDLYEEVKCLEEVFMDGNSREASMNLMYISLLGLPVIPEVRITPKGVIDVIERKIISPIAFVR
jgi:adenine deaminase